MNLLQRLLAQEVDSLVDLIRLDLIELSILLARADLVEDVLSVGVGPLSDAELLDGVDEVDFGQGAV